jgi:SecD/SecF fusion protein
MQSAPGGAAEWSLESASIQQQNAETLVGFRFDAPGRAIFGDMTRRFSPQGGNIYQLGIVLDDVLISAPNINGFIPGVGTIEGGGRAGFSITEATNLRDTLNAGALPAKLTDEPIVERTIGPSLGADNLRRGLISSLFGVVVVATFLIGYYYLSGVVATCAVILNLLLILASMAMLDATFTLPGVAGIILSLGMAVDANVLIFERLREEQKRGLSIRQALSNAYDNAFSAIIDSNVTTFITAAILYFFGSEEVRGFGLTLMIGTVVSLFTALYVTKTIFAILINNFGIEDLKSIPRTFPKWDQLLTPKIDWMGKIWVLSAASVVVIAIGLTAFGYYAFVKQQMLDI